MATNNYYFVYSYTERKNYENIAKSMYKEYVPTRVFKNAKWQNCTHICRNDDEYDKYIKRYGDSKIILKTTTLDGVKYIEGGIQD